MNAIIDGISRKRRNGSRGVIRMHWYAKCRSIRFARRCLLRATSLPNRAGSELNDVATSGANYVGYRLN